MSNLAGSTSNLTIPPSNHSSTGTISYRDGNPVINFVIGEQDRYLLGSTVRMVGNMSIYKESDGAGFGTVPSTTDDLNVSPKLSAYSILDQVVISSQKNKSVIEHVKFMNRYLASYLPLVSSKEEAIGHQNSQSCMLPNVQTNKLGFVCNQNGVSAVSRLARGNAFCLDLPTGFLNSKEPIGLSGKGWGVGGLEISIHLAPDQQVLNGSWTNAFYQLTDVQLVCEVTSPSLAQLDELSRQTTGSMEYNAISSYYTTIASSNAIINFRLGLRRVLGAFINFIPSQYLNNITYDGLQTTPLINDLSAGTIAPINQIVWQRGGVRLPKMYNENANVRTNGNSTISDPEFARSFMSAFKPFMSIMSTQQSPATNNRVGFDNMEEFVDAGLMFGLGVDYSSISQTGVDFSSENFGVQMETGLTQDNPHSAFLFVRSVQTLVFNQNGLQVIQ